MSGDINEKKFKVALVIYTLIGLAGITLYQAWRFADEKQLRSRNQQHSDDVARDFELLRIAIQNFVQLNDKQPESLQELVQSNLIPTIPINPWTGNAYRYHFTNGQLEIYSNGKDNKKGGQGLNKDYSVTNPGDS